MKNQHVPMNMTANFELDEKGNIVSVSYVIVGPRGHTSSRIDAWRKDENDNQEDEVLKALIDMFVEYTKDQKRSALSFGY